MTICMPPTINYCLKSAAAITLCFQLCSAHYKASKMKNSVRIVPAINPVTMENLQLQMYCREAMHRATANRHLGLSAKRNGTQMRTKVNPWCVHCMYCGMPKGMFWDEATSNSEKIKPISLAVIELCLLESIRQTGRQAGRQLVENSIEYIFLKFCNNLLEVFRIVLKELLGLVIPNQYCQGARMELWSRFLGEFFG